MVPAMKKKEEQPKKGGRPVTGRGGCVTVSLDKGMMDALNVLKDKSKLSRQEAIRQALRGLFKQAHIDVK